MFVSVKAGPSGKGLDISTPIPDGVDLVGRATTAEFSGFCLRKEALCSSFFDAQKRTKKRAPWQALSLLLHSVRGRILPASLPCLVIQALACPFCSSAIVQGRSTSSLERRLSRDALTFAWSIEWGQNPPLNRAKGNRVINLSLVQNATTWQA